MSPAKTPITGIRAVSIPVENQDDALRFYAGTLGFITLRSRPLASTPTKSSAGDLGYGRVTGFGVAVVLMVGSPPLP